MVEDEVCCELRSAKLDGLLARNAINQNPVVSMRRLNFKKRISAKHIIAMGDY